MAKFITATRLASGTDTKLQLSREVVVVGVGVEVGVVVGVDVGWTGLVGQLVESALVQLCY